MSDNSVVTHALVLFVRLGSGLAETHRQRDPLRLGESVWGMVGTPRR